MPRAVGKPALVDLATLALTHGLMMLALIRLLSRDELDREDGARGKKARLGQDAKSGD